MSYVIKDGAGWVENPHSLFDMRKDETLKQTTFNGSLSESSEGKTFCSRGRLVTVFSSLVTLCTFSPDTNHPGVGDFTANMFCFVFLFYST